MQKIFFYGFILFWATGLSSCKSESKPQPTKEAEKPALSGLPVEMINRMVAEVDYIDYIWHDLPFSLSQEDKAGINTNISFISDESVSVLNPDCKPIGRKIYNIKGETFATADVYFSPGCYYYVFLDGEKPIYANKITAQGIQFYTQIIQSQTGQ